VPSPGTVLTRNFQGKILTVQVLEDGFQYDNRVYRSLSAVARQISGSQWNGFLFFGLNAPAEALNDEKRA
jgi:hypothetical protein